MKNTLAVNIFHSLRFLTYEEYEELRQYREPLYALIRAKYPHSNWCELVTGLWHDCDCGASDDRTRAMDKVTCVWLKRNGKYVELNGNL